MLVVQLPPGIQRDDARLDFFPGTPTWLLLSRGVLEVRLRLNARRGWRSPPDTEVWFADGRTVDDYLALFRRNNGVR
jgi:hypothetical protein